MSQAAVVTGAANGIGRAIAKELSHVCEKLFLLDKDSQGLKQTTSEIGDTTAVDQRTIDLTHANELQSLAIEIFKQHDIDLLVNNAGYGGPFHRTDEVSIAEWDEIFAINAKAPFILTKHALPRMKERDFGRIINISSLLGVLGSPCSSTYSAAKHAMIGYTKSIAAEWGAFGITCNAICPGYINTQMGIRPDKVGDHLNRVLSQTPTKTVGSPEDIAKMVIYLASENASYINGATMMIDGGISCHPGIV